MLGKKIELLTEDDQSKAGEPATIVNKLISRDGVVAILGEVASSRSLEAAPIAQAAKIPMISPASTNPKVTEVGDYIFRVCFIDPFQGTVMAKFAKRPSRRKKSPSSPTRRATTAWASPSISRSSSPKTAARSPPSRLQRRRQGFQSAAHRHQGRRSRCHLRSRLLQRSRPDRHPGQGARPDRPAVRWRRLGVGDLLQVGKDAVEGTISPPTARPKTPRRR